MQRHPSALVADDDPETRSMLTSVLRSAGFEVQEASNGRELVRRFESGHPEVVVTDVEMPKMSGLQALERMHDQRPSAPVIVVTGFTDPRVRLDAIRLGAAAVFEKPVDLRALRDRALELTKS